MAHKHTTGAGGGSLAHLTAGHYTRLPESLAFASPLGKGALSLVGPQTASQSVRSGTLGAKESGT